MKKIFLVFSLLLSTATILRAQYTLQGKIEYERKVNVYAQMDDGDNNEWFERVKSQIPKFSLSYFDLFFDTTQTLYKPGRETDKTVKMFGSGPATENIVFTDLKKQRVTASKRIYEKHFIVEDTVRKMQWRMEDEIRTIANYKCKKAVGKICDSVYVVAFYAEDIVTSGGPEMMAGLPGMILELAIPRLHTTWTATKVDITPPAASDFTVPEKGDHVTQKELYTTLQSSFEDWGKWANRNIWWSML